MNPGRELDALVAEKVMGIAIPEGADTQYLETCMDLPYYSTDIAAAWEVVEKLFQSGFDLYLETFKDDEDKPQCRVSFQAIDNQDKGSGPIYADTAPHAICLAALKAVGVEI